MSKSFTKTGVVSFNVPELTFVPGRSVHEIEAKSGFTPSEVTVKV